MLTKEKYQLLVWTQISIDFNQKQYLKMIQGLKVSKSQKCRAKHFDAHQLELFQ